MNIKKLPAFKRPREKIIEAGASSLSDSELLAILIGGGYKNKSAIQVARMILSEGLSSISSLSLKKLMSIKGVGQARACAILAVCELSKRLHMSSVPLSIETKEQAIQQLRFIRERKREHFVVLFLNARHHLIKKETISVGSIDTSIVHPREVFAPALKTRSSYMILGHNHPSGDPDPSHADILLTQRLVKASQLLGIHILDHIIVSESGSCSLKEGGYM